MLTIDVDAMGLNRFLKQVEREMVDLRELWQKLEPGLQDWFAKTFQTDGFGHWEPTSRPNPILRDTRRYIKSFTQSTADTVDIKNPMTWEFGSSVYYGQFHEFGTSKLPIRAVAGELVEHSPFIQWLSEEAEMYFQEVLTDAAT